MKSHLRKTLLFLVLAWGLSSSLLAYTATDYYNAGLQFYKAKNYSQAIQYFSAAVQLDPNNVMSLHGRANCNYLLGQYAAALTDYQQVQALQPTDQMAQFIQSLQARVGAPASAAPATAAPAAGFSPAPAPGNPMDQGVALYKSQQYQAALPYFQQAVQQNPNDYLPYYWMGADYSKLGDNRNAVVYLTLTDRLKPNPAVKAYAQKLFARLSSSDQLWVNDQLASPSAGTPARAESGKFGFRLEPSIVLINWADFNAQGVSGKAYFSQLLNSYPTLSYTAEVPAGYANLGIEPVLQLSSDLEIGLSLAYGPIGSFTETLSLPGENESTYQTFTLFSLGLNARYFFTPGTFRFFVAGGPMAASMGDAVGNNTPGNTYTASLGSTGFGGQVQLGLDWHLGNDAVITPLLGYQVLGMSALTGTTSLGTGQVTEMFNANPGAGYSLLFITSNPSGMPSGWRPVSVDLSGPFGGLTISIYF